MYFFIWTHGEENLNNIMKDFNDFKSNLDFTFECDRISINFLDLNVKFNNGEVATRFYIKPTSFIPQYLHYRLFHLYHIKWLIIYSQAFQASRLCSFVLKN